MTTAEKRAQLEAAGEPWPTCECHSVPMYWHGTSFGCRVNEREKQRARRAQRRAEGVCVHCGCEVITKSLCSSCLDRHLTASERYKATPKGRMGARRLMAQHHARRRAREGFQSTPTGQAAIAAVLAERLPGRFSGQV